MKKLKAFFYVFAKSMTSLDYYQEIVNTRVGLSVKYYLALAFFASLITTAVSTVPTIPTARNDINNLLDQALEIYPDDLVINSSNGVVNINKEEPFMIKFPDMSSEADGAQGSDLPANLITFDSDGTINDLETYDTFILVNSTNLIMRDQNKIEAYPLRDLPEGEFTKDRARELVNDLRPIAAIAPYVIFVLLLIFTFIYYFGFRLFYLVIFVAPVVWLFGKLMNQNYGFGKYFQVALHTMSVPLLIELITTSINKPIPFPMWFFMLNLLLATIATSKLKKETTQPVPPV